jgi:hypothetical protein
MQKNPQLVGALALLLLSTSSACGGLLEPDSEGDLGESDFDNLDDGPDTITPLPGTLCLAILELSGTFSPSGIEAPEGLGGGCWPFGTWTLEVKVVDSGECGEVPSAGTYEYQVSPDEDFRYVIDYPADPLRNFRLNISQEGGSICSGSFEHLAEKSVTELKPFVSMDGDMSISGDGIYEVFE